MMSKRIWVLLGLALSLFGLAGVVAQEDGQPLNIAFIFDASGSMMAGMEGRTRLAVAQDAMAELTANLPPNANTSLWVYGHRLPQDDPAASCQDIEQVIPLGPADPAAFESAVRGIQAIGYTPITDSLQLAAQTLVDQTNARNTIVLVSDGEETCGGSPCLMAQALKQANIELTVNTIGFAADDVTRRQLQCIAEVTGGTYYDAQDSAQLSEALQSAIAAPGTVRVVDETGAPLANVAFQLLDPATGEAIGGYVGSASIAAGDYRAVVAGEPAVDVPITVNAGETTDVVVDRPELGTIRMVDAQGNPLEGQLFSAANAESGEGLSATGSVQLPPGAYTVTVYTTFPYEEPVTVALDEVTDVVVRNDAGTLRMVDAQGTVLDQQLFSVVNDATSQSASAVGTLELPPGGYTVTVFTVFAYDVPATIAAGETTDIVVNTETGTIQLVDEAGAPLDELLFTVKRLDSDDATSAVGSVELPPGRYSVEVFTVFPFTTEVDVMGGETTPVEVSTAAGTIQLVDEAGNPLPEQLFTATNQSTGESKAAVGQLEVPPGAYSVEVFTVFSSTTDVEVVAGQTTEVTVSTAEGTIQLVDETSAPIPTLLFTATNQTSGQSTAAQGQVDVPPGDYSLEIFTVFSTTVDVTVTPGEITTVPVDMRAGTIRMVDGRGNPLPTVLFTVDQVDGEGLTSAMGELDVPPGLYDVEVLADKSFTIRVEVLDDEVTTVNTVNASTDRPAN